MNAKKLKTLISVVACTMAVSSASVMVVNSADVSATAYIYVDEVDGSGVRYLGPNDSNNTVFKGAGNVTVSADGTYTVKIDTASDGLKPVKEFSKLQVYIVSSEKLGNVNVSPSSLRLNGTNVKLNDDVIVQKTSDGFYFDLYDANGAKLFQASDYQNTVTTIEVDFKVSGWSTTETAPATTVVPETTVTSQTTATVPASTTVPEKSPAGAAKTGDAGVTIPVGLMATSAILAFFVLRNKK